ncbi:MAG: hypothetical protein GPJ52_16460, partial [Candidatus Heimdallarchaeota archaeon]|nr:hypothetical protein [Candidatus Heimdallarchaeota archaeon]
MDIDGQYDPKLVGIIVSSFADSGPNTVFNNTELADDEAMILAIKGMTVIGLDNPLDAIE